MCHCGSDRSMNSLGRCHTVSSPEAAKRQPAAARCAMACLRPAVGHAATWARHRAVAAVLVHAHATVSAGASSTRNSYGTAGTWVLYSTIRLPCRYIDIDIDIFGFIVTNNGVFLRSVTIIFKRLEIGAILNYCSRPVTEWVSTPRSARIPKTTLDRPKSAPSTYGPIARWARR